MAGPLGGNDDEPIAAINVVPLVDIILVVLIIFMVTAPLVLKPTIDINLPKASSGEASAPTPLNIAVRSDGAISLNGQASTLADVRRTRRRSRPRNQTRRRSFKPIVRSHSKL